MEKPQQLKEYVYIIIKSISYWEMECGNDLLFVMNYVSLK